MYSRFSRYYTYNKTSYQCLIFIVATLFIADFSEKNNCQIIFLMAELNKLLETIRDRRWRATFFINKFIIVFFLNRLIVSLLHVFLGILSPRIWHNDHREVNERMKEVLLMEWL